MKIDLYLHWLNLFQKRVPQFVLAANPEATCFSSDVNVGKPRPHKQVNSKACQWHWFPYSTDVVTITLLHLLCERQMP